MAPCWGVAAAVALACAAAGPIVQTKSGPVEGLFDAAANVNIWHSIPFAAPPIGTLRFAAPQPPAAWTDVLDVTALPPACAQTKTNATSYTGSEDCLYIQVYAPANVTGPLPVLHWIYGGEGARGLWAPPRAAVSITSFRAPSQPRLRPQWRAGGYVIGDSSNPQYIGTDLAAKTGALHADVPAIDGTQTTRGHLAPPQPTYHFRSRSCQQVPLSSHTITALGRLASWRSPRCVLLTRTGALATRACRTR